MRVVDVPIGVEAFQRHSMTEAMRADPAELLWVLVPMEDTQARFQIMRLSLTIYTACFLRTFPSSVTRDAADE